MNLRAFLACLLAIPAFSLLLPLTACDDTSDDGDDSTDAASRLTDCATPDTGPRDVVTDAKSDAKVVCCPIDEPSCHCPKMGGTRAADGTCTPSLCDAPPPMFKRYIDENGCPALKTVPYDGIQCNAPPDAGPRDAGSDATPDADDADANAEAGAP